MKDFIVVYPSDPNHFITNLFDSRVRTEKFELSRLTTAGITHAIFFGDKEVFQEELQALKQVDVAVRWIDIKITRVINIKKEKQYAHLKNTSEYEYIGRGSYWGNPYSMFAEGDSREEVIRKYKYDFEHNKFAKKERSEVFKLAGKRLGCFCKPEACHGDILAEFLNAWDDGL